MESGAGEFLIYLVPYVLLRTLQGTPNFKDFLLSYSIIEYVWLQITEGYLDTLRLSWWSRSLLSAASAVSLERDGRAPARGPLSRARWTEPHLLALFGFRSWYRPPRGSHSTAQRRSFQIAPSCWCRDAGHQGQENDQRRTI